MTGKGISVIVCGGRTYDNAAHVRFVLDALHRDRDIWHVITGYAFGVDRLAEAWAEGKGIRVSRYPANWHPIRNRAMIRMERPELVVAFPGGSGTADMVAAAKDAGVEVYEAGEAEGA